MLPLQRLIPDDPCLIFFAHKNKELQLPGNIEHRELRFAVNGPPLLQQISRLLGVNRVSQVCGVRRMDCLYDSDQEPFFLNPIE